MFSDRLREIREKRGLTQAEAAAAIEIAPSSYSAYELGRQNPRADVIVRMCKVFNVSADWLLETDKVGGISTTADMLKAILEIEKTGSKIITSTLKVLVEEPGKETLISKATVAVLIEGVDIAPLLETRQHLVDMIRRETMPPDVLNVWLDAELNRLSGGVEGKIQPYDQDLATAIKYRLDNEMFDLTTLT